MKLPPVSAKKLLKILLKEGYIIKSRTGSHVNLAKTDYPYNRVTIPLHGTIKKGTLMRVLKQAQMSKQNLIKKLK
jgi:predicted RNA binding protein YcfA (HicA-like mRNA interferase family)